MQWEYKNLIIVSGASGTGKSFLLKKLKKGDNSDFVTSVFEEVNAPMQSLIKLVSIKKFLSLRRKNLRSPKKSSKTAFIHYDITGTRQALKRDCLLELMDKSDNISIIILYTPYRYWRERMLNRQESKLSKKLPKKVRSILDLRFNYLMGRLRYRNTYTEWQNFLSESNVHKILFIDSCLEKIFDRLPSDFSAFPFAQFLKLYSTYRYK